MEGLQKGFRAQAPFSALSASQAGSWEFQNRERQEVYKFITSVSPFIQQRLWGLGGKVGAGLIRFTQTEISLALGG